MIWHQLRLWLGHILAAVAAVLAIVMVYSTIRAIITVDPEGTMNLATVALSCLVIAFALGGLSATTWMDRHDRLAYTRRHALRPFDATDG